MIKHALAIVFLLAALSSRADSWALPERETFESDDGRWRLTVVPKELESQLAYFSDKAEGVPNAGARTSASDNRARAELYKKEAHGTWRLTARWNLVNEVAPVSALVGNDGTVITFDNWHSAGYGDDVIVIYRATGELVRQLGLADVLQEEDIAQLRHSVSSIWWSGTHRIDHGQRQLILQIDAHRMEELPLSLDTGELLTPKRVLFPPPKISWVAEDMGVETCDGAIAMTAESFAEQAITATMPEYPAVARKARIGGSVILQIDIDEDGLVQRVVILKPLPFGLDEAARDAVAAWRFRPLERNGQRMKQCAQVKMTFDLTH